MCPSCESKPIVPEHGVCNDCAAMYEASLGPDWKNTVVGSFLVTSNRETAKLNERIAHEPTGYDIETLPDQVEEVAVNTSKSTCLDDMIEALVTKHGWGYRRIHDFLSKSEYNLPSLATVKRRVASIRQRKAA